MRETIRAWAEAPEISARSTLVTIIGDTLVPIGSSLWVSQMLQLTECFGFTDRLVRTSMNRLVAEDWLYSERVGRQSRYHLTDRAVTESARAAERIYGIEDTDWAGDWVLVFVPPMLTTSELVSISEHFRWNGFVPVSPRVLAAPGVKPETAREMMTIVSPKTRAVIATATFTELADVVEDGFFIAESDSDELASAYSHFADRYEQLLSGLQTRSTSAKTLDPVDAFGLRTMLVHDLRRIRLRWPDLPLHARPADWPGGRASAVASALYSDLATRSADWLSDVFDVTYPTTFPTRFAVSYDPHKRAMKEKT